jgi:hypothetical protein
MSGQFTCPTKYFIVRGSGTDRPGNIFIEFLGLALHHPDGILGTMSQAGSQTVAVFVADQPGLALNDLQRTLDTVGDAFSAAVAFILVYLDYFAFHEIL